RRLIIPPLKRRLNTHSGEGLRILELGCGTGRATRFLRLALPKAKLTAVDLSSPYLKIAQENLDSLTRVDFLEADAENLPFRDGYFDAVVSVFLMHEIPKENRRSIVREAKRLLKPGGWLVT